MDEGTKKRSIDAQLVAMPGWPLMMNSRVAALYVGERSVRSFRRRVGLIYPLPIRVEGRGDIWLKTRMDEFADRLAKVLDAADVLE